MAFMRYGNAVSIKATDAASLPLEQGDDVVGLSGKTSGLRGVVVAHNGGTMSVLIEGSDTPQEFAPSAFRRV